MSEELIEMLIDEINSVPASEITPENEKIQSFTNGLEVLSTILAHEDLKLPNITNGRKKLEKTICFLIELLPENMYSGVSYRSFKKERELIQNGTRAIKTFFCWRFSQLTHPIKDLPPGISHTPEKYCKLFIEEGIETMLKRFVQTEDKKSYIRTKSKIVLERIERSNKKEYFI